VFANNRRIGHRGWVWWQKDPYLEDGTLANPDYLTDEEKSNCNEWLYKGLACQNTSLLSAFRYVAKPGPMHCEAHKDKGLLTIVLNPCGLEARVDGEWVPMSKDELGRPLGPNCAVVFSGQTLEAATAGAFRATEHRVRNVGGERTSIVAKIRCSPDAELNVPWAVRKVHAAGAPAPASVSVAELLTQVDAGRHGSSRSVNHQKHRDSSASGGSGASKALDLPPTKKPTPEHVFGRLAMAGHTGLGLAGLPIEALMQILCEAGVVSLGRLACVCVWLRQLATHEHCWVTAANAANMDWVTMFAAQTQSTAGAAVRWHVALGPRLSAWEQNKTISLWLTTDGDYAFTNGRALASRGEHSSIQQDMTEDPGSVRIQVDQRTALSTAVAEFVEEQFPKEGAWDDRVDVYQGRPSRLQSGNYNSDLQRVNLNLTAWHHQLEDGAILGFERAEMLAD
jgi:hypothetical protein